MVQTVKRLPTMREIRVQSLGQEDPLEKEMETHSSTLAWKIPRTEEPGGLQSMGSQRLSDFSFFLWKPEQSRSHSFDEVQTRSAFCVPPDGSPASGKRGWGVVVFWIQKYAILEFSVMGNTNKYTCWFSTKQSVGVLYKLITIVR